MTQNFTSTLIIIGYRRVIIPDYSHISVGDIGTDEMFLIQTMLIQ